MKRWIAAALALFLALPAAAALKVKGRSYPDTVTQAGKELHRVGAGVRNKWFFDVYVLAAYAESKTCDPARLVRADEVKYLRIDMLRDVSAKRMASTIGGSFDDHMPKDAPASLKKQRQVFEGYFKEELGEGTTLEFLYVPGKGTVVRQAGKQLGPPLEGALFQQVLWDIYFGPDTCCDDLKAQILESCPR